MAHQLLGCILLLALSSEGKEKTRWSRQLSSYTADISDWVPLPGPVEQEPMQIRRQAIAEPRILSEPFPGFARSNGFGQEEFPPRPLFNSPPNRQLYLQAVPSAPQNYLTDQGFGQGLKFGLTQPNFPLSQGFVSPSFNFDGIPQIKSRPPGISAVKFDTFGKPIQPQGKPYFGLPAKPKVESPKFVDGYRVENNSEIGMKKKAPTLQQVKFDNIEKVKEAPMQGKPKSEREEVQLLYVPVESLNRGQFNFRSPLTSSQIVNTDFYSQGPRVNPLRQNLATEFQRPLPKPLDSFNSQEALNDFNRQLIGFERESSKFSTLTSPFPTVSSTTPQPKKLKPHQPPLAIFLSPETKQDNVKVGDVLLSLKNADTIPVLDSVNPLNAPKVFIGPSSLTPPENFVKFDLPYLSNIENVDKKLRQLPFFVAPLSYSTPQGFAKIPFPSPHVGSVVINSQIRDQPKAPSPQSISDSYDVPYVRQQPQIYRQQYQQQNTGTQKPQITYYSTGAPKPVTPPDNKQNYYSIEQQTVSSLSPLPTPKEPSQNVQSSVKPESYLLGNFRDQYNRNQYVNFPSEVNQQVTQPAKTQSIAHEIGTTTTPSTTVSTTKPSSTYSNQLLETHNPYSINHAFHFNTPVDYQNFFDEYKPSPVTPGATSPPATESAVILSTERNVVRNQNSNGKYSNNNYVQNYSPEIHYESEIHSSRRPSYNTRDYTTNINNEVITQTERNVPKPDDSFYKTGEVIQNNKEAQTYQESIETKEPEDVNKLTPTSSNYTPETTPENYESSKIQTLQYGQYDTNYRTENIQPTEPSSTTTTTTTTTRRTPLRTRGRPRYTTSRSDSNDYTTRPTVTRRPFRERRPTPSKSRYEPTRTSTEKTIKDESDTTESTSKVTRTRGRIHYRPTAGDDISGKRPKPKDDLAYQRDVLHQNYPVTLMERTSTVDIEAITEPTAKQQITNADDDFKMYDTENAYTNDKLSITEHDNPEQTRETYTPKEGSVELEIPIVQNDQINTNKDNFYYARSSVAPSVDGYEEAKEQLSEDYKSEKADEVYATSSVSPVTEQNIPNYSANNEYPTEKEETATLQDVEPTKVTSLQSEEKDLEEKVVETTPSYNRVRVRPSLVRQYHQVSSTESSKVKSERKKLTQQPITYRPAFDRRRTTMRIEEIEADLKTKPIHSRPEYDNHKHPVYKPEPSTEATLQAQITEAGNKRGQFRRRRPVYATTTTESASRRPYEVKNRFRGRRPTDKPTDNPEIQTEISTTSTTKSTLFNRYYHRTKLSERFNKKPEQEEAVTEDQESNYSINRPKYASPDSDKWSPTISKDSFKPYNPNELDDDTKLEKKQVEDELDIITARNEYEDILISVTPATNKNNRVNKKIADIPPTLEAYVEQSKVSKTEASDPSSTFETMLEEVMKSLEEQDEDEYTHKVMKHKGGEIGEIPPEKIISSGVNYSIKSTTPVQEETTTYQTIPEEQTQENDELEPNPKNRRRGFWKKVKVRPLTESFEVAESQYYPNTVNTIGQSISKTFEKSSENLKKKIKVTTYKPSYQFIKDFFENEEEAFDLSPNIDIPRINATRQPDQHAEKLVLTTESALSKEISAITFNPGDMDWGTGSPDPTFGDASYYTEATQPTIDRSDGFSFMEYLFGVTSEEEWQKKRELEELPTKTPDLETEATKGTTDSYIPEEVTAETVTETSVTEMLRNKTEAFIQLETSSVSSFMDPSNVISTSMSTEVSHETEICFRGKCIKSKKDQL